MSHPIFPPRSATPVLAGTVVATVIAAIVCGFYSAPCNKSGCAAAASPPLAARAPADNVQLSDSHLGSIKVKAVADRDFPVQNEAVGNIDFNEDRYVQVFAPYEGRIGQAFANLGDEVKKD
jgi:membrane fusion protein, heavy metal efflux system